MIGRSKNSERMWARTENYCKLIIVSSIVLWFFHPIWWRLTLDSLSPIAHFDVGTLGFDFIFMDPRSMVTRRSDPEIWPFQNPGTHREVRRSEVAGSRDGSAEESTVTGQSSGKRNTRRRENGTPVAVSEEESSKLVSTSSDFDLVPFLTEIVCFFFIHKLLIAAFSELFFSCLFLMTFRLDFFTKPTFWIRNLMTVTCWYQRVMESRKLITF